MAKAQRVKKAAQEAAPVLAGDGPWRVRIAEGPEGLEAEMNEAESLGYTIDDLLDVDPEPISGKLRWLVLSRLADEEPPSAEGD